MENDSEVLILIDRSIDGTGDPYIFRELTPEQITEAGESICRETYVLGRVSCERNHFDFGSRLKAIRDTGLFNALGYNSYTEFFEAKFGDKSQSSRLIKASELLAHMHGRVKVFPENTYQLEGLLTLRPEIAIQEWNQLVSENGGTTPCGSRVIAHLHAKGLRKQRIIPLDIDVLVARLRQDLQRIIDPKTRGIVEVCIAGLEECSSAKRVLDSSTTGERPIVKVDDTADAIPTVEPPNSLQHVGDRPQSEADSATFSIAPSAEGVAVTATNSPHHIRFDVVPLFPETTPEVATDSGTKAQDIAAAATPDTAEAVQVVANTATTKPNPSIQPTYLEGDVLTAGAAPTVDKNEVPSMASSATASDHESDAKTETTFAESTEPKYIYGPKEERLGTAFAMAGAKIESQAILDGASIHVELSVTPGDSRLKTNFVTPPWFATSGNARDSRIILRRTMPATRTEELPQEIAFSIGYLTSGGNLEVLRTFFGASMVASAEVWSASQDRDKTQLSCAIGVNET